MAYPDFTDAALKLARARQHIKDLDSRIARYLDSDFYSLSIEPDETRTRMRLVFKSLHEPDKAINTVIGDAIGNIRSALDYMAVAMIAPIVGKTDSIGFPFADDEAGFKGLATKSWFSHTASAVQEHLIEKVQAYKGGSGNTLWAINKLRNIDKHRLLIATVDIAKIRLSLITEGLTMEDCTFGVAKGQQMMIIEGLNADVKITKNPTPLFEIRIKETGVLEDTPIIDFLLNAAEDAERLMEALRVFSK